MCKKLNCNFETKDAYVYSLNNIEKIKNEISAAGGLQNVEMIAVNYMGMHKPQGQEIIYLSAAK